MDRLPPSRPAWRTVAQDSDERDLRSVIVEALGAVILAVTDMVGRAGIAPEGDRIALTRDVILWGVEAYFGQLGGAVVSHDRAASAAPVDTAPAES